MRIGWVWKLLSRKLFVSQCLSACDKVSAAANPPPLAPSLVPPAPKPMQVDSTHLSLSERQRRIRNKLYLYCGGEKHVIVNCPVRRPRPTVSSVQLTPNIETLSCTSVHLLTSCPRLICVPAKALIDSGSAENFMSTHLLQKRNIGRHRYQQDLIVHTIQGKVIFVITQITLR